MRSESSDDLEARLDALAARVDNSLTRAREWIDRPESIARPGPGPGPEVAALEAKLQAAEASAQLQAQRCAALEDRIARFDGSGSRSEPASNPDNQLAQALQAKLLEVERLTSERNALRRSNEELRERSRNVRRELDRLGPLELELERSKVQIAELRERDETTNKRIADLDRVVAEQRRELELAERRAKHLREHFSDR